ncbi:sensor histidine kinase [Kaistia granuli]|uniref:sensor histidine kinase n=1 Tax=Kaistia granuli TaxID=363259 RepID=UPI00036EEECC|nr:sensor histidine kinase [Kaistia granuli]
MLTQRESAGQQDALSPDEVPASRRLGWRLPKRRFLAAKIWPGNLATWRLASQQDAVTGRTTWINTFRARSDRVIAIGRILLAFGSFYIVWLDSAHPPDSPELVFVLLLAYLSYAVIAAVLVWRTEISRVRGTLIRQVIDVASFAVFMFLTDGASSPFFMFMPFTLLAATLHWRWKGAFWTAIVSVGVLLFLVATDTGMPVDPDVGATTDVSRILFMVVSGILLVWLGAHQEEVRTELLRLVEKTPAVPVGREWPAKVALDYAAHVMRVPRALLIWSDADEPWTYLAVWDQGVSEIRQLPPQRYMPLTAERLQHASLLISDATASRLLIHRGEGRFSQAGGEGPLISPALIADFQIESAVSVSFTVGDLEARLFLLDPRTLTLDDVAIAEIIADRLKSLFYQATLVRKLSDAAAVEERIRIGRDLHDGVLQSLAGTALQLQALRSLDANDAIQLLDERLAAIQAMLTEEQRDLRIFIRALEPGDALGNGNDFQIKAQFDALVERLRQQWSIDFRFDLDPPDPRLPATAIYELSRMISEATANAARHGAARSVRARLRLDAGTVVLTVDDDGTGFGFGRRLEHAELESSNAGPRSLRERAAARGGTLTIDQVAQWTRIIIQFPTQL